jgi:hypothetical protein
MNQNSSQKPPKMAVEHNYLKIVVYRVNPDDRRTTSMSPNEAPEMTRPKSLQTYEVPIAVEGFENLICETWLGYSIIKLTSWRS